MWHLVCYKPTYNPDLHKPTASTSLGVWNYVSKVYAYSLHYFYEVERICMCVCMHVFMSVWVYECVFLCVFEGERSDAIADGAP